MEPGSSRVTDAAAAAVLLLVVEFFPAGGDVSQLAANSTLWPQLTFDDKKEKQKWGEAQKEASLDEL